MRRRWCSPSMRGGGPPSGWNVFSRGGRDDEGIDAVEWAARGE